MKLSIIAANGREVVLEIAGPGTIFGELAVLNGRRDGRMRQPSPPAAFWRSTAPSSATCSPPRRTPCSRRSGLLSERLSTVTAREMDTMSLPAPVRLAKALLYLADLHSQRVDGACGSGSGCRSASWAR